MKIGEEVADLANKSLPVNKPNAAPANKQENPQSLWAEPVVVSQDWE